MIYEPNRSFLEIIKIYNLSLKCINIKDNVQSTFELSLFDINEFANEWK